jgi:hypothetical protein
MAATSIGMDLESERALSEKAAAEDLPTPPASQEQNERSRTKPRRPPTVTPRTFTRFFTPRSSQESPKISTSRDALRTITNSAMNRIGTTGRHSSKEGNLFGDPLGYPPRKRRRLSQSQSSPVNHEDFDEDSQHDLNIPVAQRDRNILGHAGMEQILLYTASVPTSPPLPIRRSKLLDSIDSTGAFRVNNFAGNVSLQKRPGYACIQGIFCRLFFRTSLTPEAFQEQTFNFYSRDTLDGHVVDSIPWCVASCNSTLS